ncbi:autotransporter outer membrane beta-barrel domain-containing protein [Actinobacillus equuli]|uniref:autotransporter outer membrane beta-barrel domain-containing protein n=1 Tax=Actinobacillus equuli TaxID=718 RepID=UPI002441C53C|nr:autotransporter outer membrane beta-barrel domain-containing protein [Actinobacillus equuli]WGE48689.1 autotransporter domain-containing protein [Actinobacillus equuli subsp. equuli]
MKFTKNRVALAILFGVPTVSVIVPTVAVAQTQTVNVANQNEFNNAIARASATNVLTINLTNGFTVTPITTGGKEVPWKLGNVTIIGNGHELLFRGDSALSITGDTTFQNVKLSFNQTAGVTQTNGGEAKLIFANNHHLTLDNVTTKVMEAGKADIPATVVLGSGIVTNGDLTGSTGILTLNGSTILQNIIASNLDNSAKKTASTIQIGADTTIKNEVRFGADNNPMNGKVNVITQSKNVAKYVAGTSVDNILTFQAVKTNETSIEGVKDVITTQGSSLFVNKLDIVGTLELANGVNVNATPAPDTAPITVGTVSAQGNNELSFTNQNKATITNGVQGNELKVNITGGELVKNIPYVTAGNNGTNITVAAPNSTKKAVEYTSGAYMLSDKRLLTAPVITFDNAQNGTIAPTADGKIAIKVNVDFMEMQDGDEITIKINVDGVKKEETLIITPDDYDAGNTEFTVKVDAKAGQTIEVEAVQYDGFTPTDRTPTSKPVIVKVEDINTTAKAEEVNKKPTTQKGSGVTETEKPAADTPEITQKGSGVTETEKPAADVPEISQKGSGVTETEKPTADTPEITRKGSSLTADEKATANTPAVTEKGSSVTEAEKSAADVPETTQKGTSATAEEKPVVEPVVQQTLASLTAEKPEVDTKALIAALHQAEMLLQQQQKAQRISNLVESNAAAQLNSIADVNMDIAQQVIEKFPTDGNQFRVWSNNTVTNSSAYRNTQQHYETDSFRSQLGVSGLVNANTQLGAILTDVRNSNDFAYNNGKHHLQIASAFVKYQTNNGTFAAFDLGAGRIKNKLKSVNQTDSFSRKLVQTGLTLGQELTWNQLEATVKTGIRYNHLGHANYQLDGLNVQEQAVDFVSYFAGLELGYKFALGTQFSVKPLISAEYWVHNGNAEIKVADREFSLETGNRQHFAAGVEMGYQNLKLSLSAGVTDGSKVAKQNVAKLNLNYQF